MEVERCVPFAALAVVLGEGRGRLCVCCGGGMGLARVWGRAEAGQVGLRKRPSPSARVGWFSVDWGVVSSGGVWVVEGAAAAAACWARFAAAFCAASLAMRRLLSEALLVFGVGSVGVVDVFSSFCSDERAFRLGMFRVPRESTGGMISDGAKPFFSLSSKLQGPCLGGPKPSAGT